MADARGGGIAERKNAWRRLGRELFALMPREERAALDAALCERLRDCVRPVGAEVLLGYMPMRDEVDATAFFRWWVAEGGRLALPVWVGERDLLLREVGDLDAQAAPGRGGILEPVAGCAEVAAGAIDFVIAPGRFFSERCERLGRGAGCYDALPVRQGVKTLGVAYDFQIVPALPVDAHDAPVDAVLTPTRLIGKWKRRGRF